MVVPRKGKKRSGGKKSSGASSTTQLKNAAMGGAIVGAAEASQGKPGGFLSPDKAAAGDGQGTLGALKALGEAAGPAAIALAAHFVGKGKPGLLTNARNAAAAVAVAAMVKEKMEKKA
jgi:hypothetical protein